MRVLITGASGQDGRYMEQLCTAAGARVVRAGRTGPDVALDPANGDHVHVVIRELQPDYVFHFAADSTLAHEGLLSNHRAISTGAINLLEACHRHCRGARVFLPGSALQFENVGKPIDEDTPFGAGNAYAVARIHTTYLARYFRSLGLRVYVGFLFHHDSPLRTSRHMSQKICQAAVRVAAGRGEKLPVGDLAAEKEWSFAGDVVRAIWLLVNQEEIFEVVIGSGQTRPVQAWIEACFGLVGRDWRPWITPLPGYRPGFARLVSNPARIRGLGWTPEVDFNSLAALMVKNNQAQMP